MKKVAINGRFLARKQTGQERFAAETIFELDKIVIENQYELIVPLEYKGDINLKNIKVVRYGNVKSHLWEQTNFAWYVRRHRRLSLNLCTIQPLLAVGVVCIHDISYKINPQYFLTSYGRKSSLWHRFNYYVAAKFSPAILTVTNNSKREIIDTYKVKPDKITVVPNGWEHILRIVADDSVKVRFSNINLGIFYITIGSLAPNKNIKWIFDVAKSNPQQQFVIVGRKSWKEYGIDYTSDTIQNVIMTGYLSDGELKYLLQNCKALIFPSFYEGFGIPPLEALALGKEAIVAKASCMPEIFQDCVHYLNPYDPDVDIESLMNSKVDSPNKLLEKYSYANAAKKIHATLSSI